MTNARVHNEEEKKELIRRYRALLRSANKNDLTKADREKISKAFNIAVNAHSDVRRKSGEPYIFHPLAVAQIVADDIGLGATSIACALMHDVVEDTEISLDYLRQNFDDQTAKIIDGLTKISSLVDQHGSLQAENFKKMLLTLNDDIRVILIKLADRLHNMRTLDSMSSNSQLKIAAETQYIFAPLAHRLGLYNLKTELEDLALRYLHPVEYRKIADKLAASKTQRSRYINQFISPIEKRLENLKLKFEIKGRAKSIFSIYNKMEKNNIEFEDLYDIFAIRIILDSPVETEKNDCWLVYGALTEIYTPVPNRFKDWISNPKENGYESIHNTFIGPNGRYVEVQIRSSRMDEIAEKGYAAHWKYKEGLELPADVQKQDIRESSIEEWLKKVREGLEASKGTALELLEDFRLNLYTEEIFVFTPKGDLKKLPLGATALDFAFEIHTDVGSKCLGAKVNGKMLPLSQKLKSGDRIEIITSQTQRPHEDWLRFVVTSKARQRIREALREEKKVVAEIGKEILQKKFVSADVPFNIQKIEELVTYYKLSSALDLYYEIATGKIARDKIDIKKTFEEIYKRKTENKPQTDESKVKIHQNFKRTKVNNKDTIILGEDLELDYTFAKCCTPIPGDDVFGFVTIGEGIKIHRTDCPNATSLFSQYGYRIMRARWASEDSKSNFLASIAVSGIDSVGMVSSITNVISKELKVNMQSISFDSKDGVFEGKINLYITDVRHLESLMVKLKSITGLDNVKRINA
jgi:guanosine-3',5'-bis(diphosphate) 3'-pyrophosphohydrolase